VQKKEKELKVMSEIQLYIHELHLYEFWCVYVLIWLLCRWVFGWVYFSMCVNRCRGRFGVNTPQYTQFHTGASKGEVTIVPMNTSKQVMQSKKVTCQVAPANPEPVLSQGQKS
jgi:hypothetical protein